ncbi:hypothetical protein [Vibrio porteresiae]|uniref:Uncharacterized protein n=1 Tax=Vibrio porteresiae DSM 19223 TaxID=1123496 RepID=A0ABZ0QGJ2_9VIBR|nr:hypothetical protein [Vibrio porteresiae]WPC74581.1 hypothetical protein R8Z52_04970 [Vibrio porteresiae DSM 19223]
MSISKNKRQFTVSVLSSLTALALAGCAVQTAVIQNHQVHRVTLFKPLMVT